VIRNCQVTRLAFNKDSIQLAIGNWQSAMFYSARSASIGSSLAARHAGQSPLMIPTTDDVVTPKTAEVALIRSGNPINADLK
jgi:hypothetical protein